MRGQRPPQVSQKLIFAEILKKDLHFLPVYVIMITIYFDVERRYNMKRKFTAAAAAVLSAISAAAFFSMNAFAEGEAASGDTAAQGNTGGGMTSLIVSMLLMLALLYFMAIRPQKKREKEAADMQKGLQIGDEIVTTGGIVGMITRIGDDNVVIETGGERNKIRIKKWAVAENITAAERTRAEKAKAAKNSPLAAAGVAESETEKKKSKKEKKSSDENK